MSHEITVRADGTAEMAFTGPRSAIWHGLGQELPQDMTIEQWQEAAGMDWSVQTSPVTFSNGEEQVEYPDRVVLFRGDNKSPLSIVSPDFKIVQPTEILEFFRDLVDNNGMRLSTAGTLFGGKRFWALADTGFADDITDGDSVQGHLLLTTSVDGTMSTQAKFVSTRVVCSNTMSVALSERSKVMTRVTHKREFDAEDVKVNLGLLERSWVDFIKSLRKLANTPMDSDQTRKFYEEQFFDPQKTANEQGWGATREVNRLVGYAQHGSGSDMSRGTAWGALCGATELFTHGPENGRKAPDKLFWDTYQGSLDNKKTSVFTELMALC